MTLFQKTCALAKKLVHSEPRKRISHALLDAHKSKSQSTNIAALMGRDLRKFFTGYLWANANFAAVADRLNLPPSLAPHAFEPDVWLELSNGDAFLRHLNAAIVDAISQHLGDFAPACDPFIRSDANLQSSAATAQPLADEAREEIAAILAEIVKHPHILEARMLLKEVDLEQHTPLRMREAVQALDMIVSPKVPQVQLDRLRGNNKLDSAPIRALMRLTLALYSVRLTMDAIDWIIFDSFQKDRLSALSAENVFEVVGSTSDSLGSEWELRFQPPPMPFDLSPGGVLVLAPPPVGSFPKGPARLQTMHFRMTKEFGSEITAVVRPLDDWLNQYPRLLSQ